jgi:hypothetical protein
MVDRSDPELLNLEQIVGSEVVSEGFIVLVLCSVSALLQVLDADNEVREVDPVSLRSRLHQE